MKSIREIIFSKSFLKSFLVSTLILIMCFSIIIFRVFSPHHRLLAIFLYILSWAVFIIPFIKKKNIEKLNNDPNIKFLKRHYVNVVGLILFIIGVYALFTVIPMDKTMFDDSSLTNLSQKMDKDEIKVKKIIKSLETSFSLLEESELLKLTIETTTPEKNAELKSYFSNIVSNIIALEQYMDDYKYFHQISYFKYRNYNERAFLIAYASYITKYRIIYDLSNSINNNEFIEILLNEKINDFESINLYQNLKKRFNHPKTIIRINLGNVYLKSFKYNKNSFLSNHSKIDYSHIFDDPKKTFYNSVDNILDGLEQNTMENWIPIQKKISIALGDTKITSRHEYFISDKQITELYNILEPGDLMLVRRNWYVSNPNMPGFWTHSAMYLGNLTLLDNYFENESFSMLGMQLSDYIKINYPKAYKNKIQKDKQGNYPTTIEAISEGVSMLTLKESADADYLTVLRPKRSKSTKLKAVLFTLENYEKPYDFNFDFETDDSFVCTELLYKAYLTDGKENGQNYELEKIVGRWLISPNGMVKEFDITYNTSNQQNEFIIFLDGNEEKQVAFERNIDELRKSWKRPKLSMFLD